jgi:exopolysaccharide production protein ExoQ
MTMRAVERSLDFASVKPRRLDAGLPQLSQAILFIAVLFNLGVFEPKLDPLILDSTSVANAVAINLSASPYNQLKWGLLVVIASWLALKAPRPVLQIGMLLWPLGLLLLYAVLSVLWSDHPEITLRRSVGLVAVAYVIVVATAFLPTVRQAILPLFLAFLVVLIVTGAAASSAVAFDSAGQFRGAAGHKNLLGGIAACGIIIGVATWCCFTSTWTRALVLPYLASWTVVLAATGSKTSIALLILSPMVFLNILAIARVIRTSLGVAATVVLLFVLTLLGLVKTGSGYSVFDLIQVMGGDPTFTNRTPIWQFVLAQINLDRILLGQGFGAVWGVGLDAANLASPHIYIRLINTGHNGYLDILASLGLIGILLWTVLVMHFGALAERLRGKSTVAFGFVWSVMIFFLLHNFMESTFAMPFDPVWTVVLVSLCIAARLATSGLHDADAH